MLKKEQHNSSKEHYFLLQSDFLSNDPQYLFKEILLIHFTTFPRYSLTFLLTFILNLK